MKPVFVILLSIIFISISTTAYACRPLISEERSKQIIESASFIGLAKVLKTTKTKNGIIETITFSPVFAYKEADGFNANKNITISLDTETLSSCDYRPQANGGMYEIILFKDANEKLRLGNTADMALGDSWKKLREKVEYIK